MFLDNVVKYMKMFFIGFQKKSNCFQHLIAGRQNWHFWGLLWVGLCVGQTPNVPKWVGIKLFFKCAVGKILKTICVGMSVGKVRSVCVKEQRKSLSSYCRFVVAVSL
jgi:hypothetical protein